MRLSEVRQIIRFVTRSNETSFDDQDIDWAFKFACNYLLREARILRTQTSVSLTAYNQQAALTVTAWFGFTPERVIKAVCGYNSRGTWANATAYLKNDLVRGDGSPDTLLYACNTAHTSGSDSEPPNASYWDRVYWQAGTDIQVVDEGSLIDAYSGGAGFRRWPHEAGASTGETGRPSALAFVNDTTIAVHPLPDFAYPVTLTWWKSLPDFDAGTKAEIDLGIPDPYLMDVLHLGAPAVLDCTEPAALPTNKLWVQFLDSVRRIKGQASNRSPGVSWKDPTQYE